MAADKTTMHLSGHGKTVDIIFNKLEFDYNKNIIIQKIPSTSDGEHTDSTNLNIDLGWITKVISLTNGYLLDDTTSSAWQKKIDLDYMADKKGSIVITWQENYPEGSASAPYTVKDNEGNTGYTVGIIKYKITEAPWRIGTTADNLSGNVTTGQTKMFLINIQFSIGKHTG